jgi:hypothetical protein
MQTRPLTVRIDPDYQKFDRALKTQVRPVWAGAAGVEWIPNGISASGSSW